MTGQTRWWWLRHAPVPSPEGRIVGRLDLSCDTSEADEFAALAALLPRNPVLVESGLLRCQQTAEALSQAGLALPPPILEPDLAEQDFGQWQGHTWPELDGAKDPDLKAFWDDPAYAAPPGGESFADVVHRVSKVVRRLSAEHSGRDIIAVAHAGSIRAALAVALDIAPEVALRFAVAPLSLTRLDLTLDGWRIECVNTTALTRD